MTGRYDFGIESLPLAENPPVRTLPPWQYEPTVAPPARRTNCPGTFTRMVPLDPARLDSLPTWWRRRERGGRVDVASRLFLEEPRSELLGMWRIGGSLRRPARRRSIPIDLWLWPRLDAWTILELDPMQPVRIGGHYFSRGQRLLDVLCDRLITELDATPAHFRERAAGPDS